MNLTLQIRNLNKSYVQRNVLSNIDLEISPGSIHGLVGLNGAGKTTLIKCILDLQSADSGEIRVHGIPSTRTEARDMLVYLPERFSAPDYMDGWTYLQFIADAHLAGLKRDESRARSENLCAKLEFAVEALDKPVQALSKGMAQKLAIVGCLLSGKEFLILDEPMSGLDPKARVLFRKVVEELRSEGKTVLLCSHILSDIENLCDQATILHEGRIVFSGSAQNCCRHYGAKDFESAFLKCIENPRIVSDADRV
jgi:ABC-2 type transport system ATP-binding protein